MDGLRYIIARANTISDLETVVRQLIDKGYTPIGGVIIENENNGINKHYLQAVWLN